MRAASNPESALQPRIPDCRLAPPPDDDGRRAMRTDLFDFELPAERIALRPASPRDSARMLVVQPDGALRDQHRRAICRNG